MKKLILTFALVPALALAAQGTPARGPGQAAGSDDSSRMEQLHKRVRLARTLGLAEALDLDAAGAMRLRDVLARFDERRIPLRKQLRDNVRILRDAARGDKDAAGQVDAALQKLRETRTQLQNLNSEMLQQIAQGLSPEKKARAALFLSRFHEREHRMFKVRAPGPGGGRGHGRGAMMMEDDDMGPGPGMMEGPRHAMVIGEGPGPDADEWFVEDE